MIIISHYKPRFFKFVNKTKVIILGSILQESTISVFLLVTCHFFVIVCEINLTNLKKQQI